MANMKALSLRIKKLWLMIKVIKSRSKVTVKVTCSKFIVPPEWSCHKGKRAKYESPQDITLDKKVMANVSKVGQRSRIVTLTFNLLTP